MGKNAKNNSSKLRNYILRFITVQIVKLRLSVHRKKYKLT